MAVVGVILLAVAVLAIRSRLMKLALRRGGADHPAQSEESAPAQHGRPAG